MIKCVGENKAFECENCASAFSKVDALKAHTSHKVVQSNAISVIKSAKVHFTWKSAFQQLTDYK